MAKDLVIGLVAQNENRALLASAQNMAALFALLGYRHQVIDLLAPDGFAVLSAALREGSVAFAYGFAGVGSQLTRPDGANLWESAQTPFIALWYDHPAYNYRQHSFTGPYILHGYHVRDHFEARQKYLATFGDASAFLLPQLKGGNPALGQTTWSHRSATLLYVKSARDPELWAKDWDRHPPALRDILWALAEQAKADRNLDLADATSALFKTSLMDVGNLDLFMGVVQEVDAYIRAWRSDRFARALLPHDALIAGQGWDYLQDRPRRATILPAFPATELPMKIAQHRIMANTNPLWRDGIHERVLMGCESGALTLTDASVAADALFSSLPNYVPFEWNENLADVIANALRHAETEPCSPVRLLAFFEEQCIATHRQWMQALRGALDQLALRVATPELSARP